MTQAFPTKKLVNMLVYANNKIETYPRNFNAVTTGDGDIPRPTGGRTFIERSVTKSQRAF